MPSLVCSILFIQRYWNFQTHFTFLTVGSARQNVTALDQLVQDALHVNPTACMISTRTNCARAGDDLHFEGWPKSDHTRLYLRLPRLLFRQLPRDRQMYPPIAIWRLFPLTRRQSRSPSYQIKPHPPSRPALPYQAHPWSPLLPRSILTPRSLALRYVYRG